MSYKTALVTGGNSGIGRATAIKLAGQGLHIIMSGRDEARGAVVADLVRSRGGQADFVAAELRSEADARALAHRALELTNDRVDVLVKTPPASRSAQPSARPRTSSTWPTASGSRCRTSWSPSSRLGWHNAVPAPS